MPRQAAGSRCEKFEGEPHTFVSVNPASPASVEALRLITDFIREAQTRLESPFAVPSDAPRPSIEPENFQMFYRAILMALLLGAMALPARRPNIPITRSG